MNPTPHRITVLFLALMAWGALTGCSAFKPVAVQERHFVLSPQEPQTAVSAPGATTAVWAVGVGPVRVAAYLLPRTLAVRRGPNEVRYSDGMFWAERVDKGAQRVLAINLAQSLPHLAVKPFPWKSDEVSAEVRVQLDQLDVDPAGQGVLEASWRILVPQEERVVRSGRTRQTLTGPPPASRPEGAVATLSVLLGRLSEELAAALAQEAGR
jgi:uncharacterized lipoprotein YmbA